MYTLSGILMMILGVIICKYKVKDEYWNGGNQVAGGCFILIGLMMFYYGTSPLLEKLFTLIR